MTDNTVESLVDFVVLQLLDVPDERRTEASVHLLHEYNQLLGTRFPELSAQREKFLVLFFRLLTKRMAEMSMSGGTGGRA